MNTHLTTEKLEDLIGKNIKSSLSASIVKLNKNVYRLFNTYTVYVKVDGVKVKKSERCYDFSSLRAALSWCTLDRIGDRAEAERIKVLDGDRQRIDNDISFSIEMQKNNSNHLLSVKIDYKMQILNKLKHDLKNCITKAKYIQIKEFNNEIERFRHIR